MEVAYSFKQSNLIHGVDSKWYNSDFFHPKLGFRYNNSRAASRVCLRRNLRRIGSVIGSISISGGSVPFGRDFDGLPSGKGGPLCQGNDAVVYVEGNGKSVEVGKDSDGCDSDKSLVVEGAPLSAKMVTESSAKVIDGKSVAKQIKEEIAVEIAKMKEATGIVPGLAVILVGDRKDSATYVRNKKKACDTVGINSFEVHLPENTTEQEVLKSISRFNEDPMVHGILVQLPLPSHMNEEKILNAVGIEKDVDGFHPLNIGRLAMRGREPSFVPCTPKGCIELLHRYGIQIKGKKAVVVGRSNIVGMPAALLLQREDATVTIVHSRTNNPEDIIKEADIIISAVGQANMIRGSWIKPGAVIIDVGINPVEDSDKPRGYRLVGDVCYEEVVKVASAITPVPGGVGPMTIAMLLSNTLSSAKKIHNFNS